MSLHFDTDRTDNERTRAPHDVEPLVSPVAIPVRSSQRSAGAVSEKYLSRSCESTRSGWQRRWQISLRQNSARLRRTLLQEFLNAGSIASLVACSLSSDLRQRPWLSLFSFVSSHLLLRSPLSTCPFGKPCADVHKPILKLSHSRKNGSCALSRNAMRNFPQKEFRKTCDSLLRITNMN